MGSVLRALAVTAAVSGLVFACATAPRGGFENEVEAGTPPPGVFNAPDGTGCQALTCADAKANCGPISDGCGALLDCGSCNTGETCGGGGVPSQCGKPACVAKTCAELDANCGPVGDGCGGLISSCGTCPGGICGGGGPSKCGVGDGGTCTPTKTACAAGDCGPIADGCGALLDCSPPAWPACPAGQTCGGGGTPSLCGAPPCVKNTCAAGLDCGYIADGCGGVTSCWGGALVCPPGTTCGGGAVANKCGAPPTCTGLCTQQQGCVGGATTSIEGYVTSPNGILPVPNAIVYVPNAPVDAFTPNVKCESCAALSGSPLVATTTDANGHFLLPNMPVSTPGKVTSIPVVVQLGRWRKQFTITTTACTNTLVPTATAGRAAPDTTTAALPRKQTEGDIPLTAVSTGFLDGLECVLRKIGVDDGEFTNGAGTGRVRLYQDDHVPDAGTPSGGGACAPGCGASCVASGTPACPKASTLYSPCVGAGCMNEIDKYDAVVFGCTGGVSYKPTPALNNVVDYANKGGRVFATHYSFVWLLSAAWATKVNTWTPDAAYNPVTFVVGWNYPTPPGSISAIIDTSFPKGVQFSNWLDAPVAPVSASFPPPYAPVGALVATSPPRIAITEARQDIKPTAATLSTSGIVSPAQRWIYTTDDNGISCASGATCRSGVCTAGHCVGSVVYSPATDPPAANAPMHFTFNTDITKPIAQQCGRALYSDFHVTTNPSVNPVFPAECPNTALTPQEKILAYMFFDLASCIGTVVPPGCAPKSCVDQGLGCGLAGDGCGGTIDCGACPLGKTCGGGGVPSQCGAPPCTTKTCAAGMCGKLGDGCGGTLDCGACAMGTCGGGGPNLCGAATCNPTNCPSPGPGTTCGPVADGCGKVNNCPCLASVPCVNGLCGASCTPRTCAQAGANCGQIADGCGNILNCGTCIAPQTCGGGGTPNLCGGGVN